MKLDDRMLNNDELPAGHPPMERRCVDCGIGFTLGHGEVGFFTARGLQIPKRCEACRAARKRERARDEASS